MQIKVSVIIIFFLNALNINAQDTTVQKFWKKTIVPAALIGTGLALNGSDFEHNFRHAIREKTGDDFEYKIDNYFQYVPVVELYISDIWGVKAKNHWFDQTKYLFISNILTTAITQGLKHTTLKIRPNGAPYAFPSGHTTLAFTNATVLYNEFKDSSPFLAYSGYFFSTTTGAFRILNDKHWLSDILTGAGIGIIATNLVYYFEPFKSFNPFLKSKNVSIIPQIDNSKLGFYFVYLF